MVEKPRFEDYDIRSRGYSERNVTNDDKASNYEGRKA